MEQDILNSEYFKEMIIKNRQYRFAFVKVSLDAAEAFLITDR